jgi:hypothetical protein
LWTPDGVGICTEAGQQWLPSIVSDGAGGAIIAWDDGRPSADGGIYAARIDSATNLWAPGIPVSYAPGVEQRIPEIVSDGSGGAIVSWIDTRNGLGYDIYAQRLNQYAIATWAYPGDQWYHSAVSDDAGGAIIIWSDNATVSAQRVDGAGALQWSSGGVVVDVGGIGYRTETSAVKDGAGGAVIIWTHDTMTFPQMTDIRAQAIDSSGNIKWTSGYVPICEADHEQSFARPVSDGAGGVAVAWSDARDGVVYDVFAQSVDSAGVCRWGTDGTAVCSVDGDSRGVSSVVGGGDGSAIIVWRDARDDSLYDLYARKFRIATGIDDGRTPPADRLAQNRPNPFNPVTTISYEIATAGRVSIRVYDVTGRLVRVLLDDVRSAGPHAVEWDGRDERGRPTASGVYFYKLTTKDFTKTRKMVLLK